MKLHILNKNSEPEVSEVDEPVIIKEDDAVEKRGRGRPKKVAVEVDTVDSTPVAKPAPKPKKKRVEVNREELSRKLKGWHDIGAMLMRTPELRLDDDESEMLVDSFLTLAAEYDIELSGKTAAWIGMIGTAGMVYVPRAIVIKNKIDENRKVNRAVPIPRNTEAKG